MSDVLSDVPADVSADLSADGSNANEVLETIDSTNEKLDADLEAESQEPTQEQQKEQIKQLKKMLKIKVNGKEVERELDFENDEYLREMLQKGESADQKFQESAQLRKQMESFVKLMQQDPMTALQKLGLDPDEWAEKHIEKRLEEMKKSPEQLEREAMQKELEALKKEKEDIERQKHEAEQHRIQEEYSRQLDKEITEGLAASELPKSPYVVKRVAELLMLGIQHGKDVSVKDVLPIAERQIRGEIQQMFSAMPEEVIEKVLGKDVSNKLRQSRIKKMKSTPQTPNDVKATGKSEIKNAQDKKEVKPLPAKDFFKMFGND